MSYGFAPDVLPCQVPNFQPNSAGGSSASIGGTPNIGWAITSDTSSFDGVTDVPAVSHEEVPCQSVFVPADEMPIYGNYYVSEI